MLPRALDVSALDTHLGGYNSLPGLEFQCECAKELQFDAGISAKSPVPPSGAETWGRQSNQQNLVWFRVRPGGLGVGLSCYTRLLRELARLDPFPFLR